MAADPILFVAGKWLGAAGVLLAVLTVLGFLRRWGIRFRLVGVTSFTVLLAVSCLAFSVSYRPRVTVPGAVVAPVVFDNGGDLVVAAAPAGLTDAAIQPSLEQLARNLPASGRTSADGSVRVRLRRLEPAEGGAVRPVVLGEARRDLATGTVTVGR